MLRALSALLILISFSACNSETQHAITTFSGTQMTIPYQVKVAGNLTGEQKQIIQDATTNLFLMVDQKFNKWNPQSEISKINKLKAGESAQLSPELLILFELSDRVNKISENRFDPTVETLLSHSTPLLSKGILPTDDKTKELNEKVGWDNFTITDGKISKKYTELQFDFGGIAKGHFIDLLSSRLKALGFENTYVEWGGEIKTQGVHPSGRSWNALVRSDEDILVQLNNQAIATSGDTVQYYLVHTKSPTKTVPISHIYDARLKKFKMIQKNEIFVFSIQCDDGYLADGLATAACLFPSQASLNKWLKETEAREDLKLWYHIQTTP